MAYEPRPVLYENKIYFPVMVGRLPGLKMKGNLLIA
jgi:hypothetical protein